MILSRGYIRGTLYSNDSYLDLQPTQQISNYLKLPVESRFRNFAHECWTSAILLVLLH